ncbi:hypothetical protein NXH76_13820 [Blautia schinkii]|nr:hypothetical protein [Blautia schinkii]
MNESLENTNSLRITAKAAAFLRGEIESGYSSIQDLLYRLNVCRVCLDSERNRKFIKEFLNPFKIKLCDKTNSPRITAEAAAFLRGEIESGYSSIQNLLYRLNVCKVCRLSKRNRKSINNI